LLGERIAAVRAALEVRLDEIPDQPVELAVNRLRDQRLESAVHLVEPVVNFAINELGETETIERSGTPTAVVRQGD
jgi:hypothetical protein